MAVLIDGKKIAQEIREEIKQRVHKVSQKGVRPGLAVILVGDDPASSSYVRMKTQTCDALGIYHEDHTLSAATNRDTLLALITQLNNDEKIHGILVQSPLPNGLDMDDVILAINPEKDADGFHPVSVGKNAIGLPSFKPCTPYGIQQMLIRAGYSWEGKHVVIIGRSNIVGKPLMNILVQKSAEANATVTICHSRTQNIASLTRMGDIVIAAIGQPNFLKADMVRDGVIVIDVGSNRIEDTASEKGYYFTGDVDYEAVAAKAEAITPVPGGVGPMTITMLMHNVVLAAEIKAGIL